MEGRLEDGGGWVKEGEGWVKEGWMVGRVLQGELLGKEGYEVSLELWLYHLHGTTIVYRV